MSNHHHLYENYLHHDISTKNLRNMGTFVLEKKHSKIVAFPIQESSRSPCHLWYALPSLRSTGDFAPWSESRGNIAATQSVRAVCLTQTSFNKFRIWFCFTVEIKSKFVEWVQWRRGIAHKIIIIRINFLRLTNSTNYYSLQYLRSFGPLRSICRFHFLQKLHTVRVIEFCLDSR